MSNTKTEANRPPKAIGLAEQLVSQFGDWTLAHLASDELRRLDALCDERGTNEARMLMRLTEMQATIDQLRSQLDQAVAEEREACAKVCEYQADRFMQASPLEGNRPYASHECAAAIRARSNT